MSTRGTCIIRKNGTDKGIYISSDAYPSGFGESIIDIIQTHDDKFLSRLFDDISFDDDNVLEDEMTWSFEDAVYNSEHNESSIFESNHTNFISDSLFCEYAYCVNLDTNALEFYTGFHKTDDPKKNLNRYIKLKRLNAEWASCHLAKTYPFSIIRYGADTEKRKATKNLIINSMEAYAIIISEKSYLYDNVDLNKLKVAPEEIDRYKKEKADELEKATKDAEQYELTIVEWDKGTDVEPIKNELDIKDVKEAIQTISSNIQWIKPSSQSSAKLAVTCLMDAFGI